MKQIITTTITKKSNTPRTVFAVLFDEDSIESTDVDAEGSLNGSSGLVIVIDDPTAKSFGSGSAIVMEPPVVRCTLFPRRTLLLSRMEVT